MTPGVGVEAVSGPEGCKGPSTLHSTIMSLLRASRVLGRSMTMLIAQVEGVQNKDCNPVIFQPDTDFLEEKGFQLEE